MRIKEYICIPSQPFAKSLILFCYCLLFTPSNQIPDIMTGLWRINILAKIHSHYPYEHAEAYNLGTITCFHLSFCSDIYSCDFISHFHI